jgi:hypothetical protein
MKRSEMLIEMVNGLKQGVAANFGTLSAQGKLTEARAAVEELDHKLRLAEMVQQFYDDLPDTKKMMINAALPAELKALLQKKGT